MDAGYAMMDIIRGGQLTLMIIDVLQMTGYEDTIYVWESGALAMHSKPTRHTKSQY
jgi:hypothetical protein